MANRHIFHLSIPVTDLGVAKRFYVFVLGATIGRENEAWLDVILWGHQITLQCQPSEVMALEQQGKRHFGVVLPWEKWEREAERIRASGTPFLGEPKVLLNATAEEQGKFRLADPSNNIIEVKAYRNVTGTLGVSTP